MNSEAEFVSGSGSDSDANSDAIPDYYVPISFADEGDVLDQDPDSETEINGDFHHLANGYAEAHCVENGIASLRASNEGREFDYDNEEEADAAEATEWARAIERAFTENERRRNAPLTAENSWRVVEAMREVSFGGSPPDWAGRVPEDEWIDRLRRLSRAPSASAII